MKKTILLTVTTIILSVGLIGFKSLEPKNKEVSKKTQVVNLLRAFETDEIEPAGVTNPNKYIQTI